MANRYSSGNAAQDRQIYLRRCVCEAIREIVGGAYWPDTVPLQVGEKPDFGFLREMAQVAGSARRFPALPLSAI
jgi:hypothetical protein